MVCFMYRRGCVGKMTWSLLSRNRVVCLCVCVNMEPTGMKHWSQGSTQETWMILVSMFSSLDQQDNLLKTWCVPFSFVLFSCSRGLFFSVWWSYIFCVEVGGGKEESWQCTPNICHVNRDKMACSWGMCGTFDFDRQCVVVMIPIDLTLCANFSSLW